MNQYEELLKDVGPSLLFNMTGKFGKRDALKAMNHAAGCFLLALKDMGGESEDKPEFHQLWGQSCGLPDAKAFRLLRNAMVTCGWIAQADRTDGVYLILTGKGLEKCATFAQNLKPAEESADD